MIFIVIVVIINGIAVAIHYFLNYNFCFLYLSNSGAANAQLSGCFCAWTFSLYIGLNMLPLDSLMSCLHSLQGYSTGDYTLCNWLSLRRMVPWINAWLILLEISIKMIVGLSVWRKVKQFFVVFYLFHILIPCNIMLFSFTSFSSLK